AHARPLHYSRRDLRGARRREATGSSLMSTSRFQGRTVFVSGAASGLGRATAKLFAAEGADVYAVDVDSAGLAETIESIRASGGRVEGGVCDVSSSAAGKSSIAQTMARVGRLHVVANVAGRGRPGGQQ